MQTFLPYADYHKSAMCLDPSRLGNQAYREGKTILRGGWRNHPVSKMWRGYEYSLCNYISACFMELSNRGRHYQKHIDEVIEIKSGLSNTGKPWWLGDERLHSSHRGTLLWKKPEWYSKFGWLENPLPPDENGKFQYWWAV